MIELRFARFVLLAYACLGSVWGIILAIRTLSSGDTNATFWTELVAAGVTLTLGAIIGKGTGKWMLQCLYKLRNLRPIQCISGPFLGAVSGAVALILILGIGSLFAFFTDTVDYGDVHVIELVKRVVMDAGLIGASVGAACGLLLGTAVCAFPKVHQMKVDL